MKVYLDTCVLSCLADNTLTDKQLEGLELIADNTQIDLVTSNKTLQEFVKAPQLRTKRHLKLLFKLISKVFAPPAITHFSGLMGDSPCGVALVGGGSGSVEHPTYSRLKSIFKKDDAEHIYIAKESGCDTFLTVDIKTIIRKYHRKRRQVDEIISPMRICEP